MPKRVGKVVKIAGYTVEFIRPSTSRYRSTPDVLINGEKWEMKSPRASSLKAVERNELLTYNKQLVITKVLKHRTMR